MTDWEKIVGRHGPAVWQTAYRLLGNREEAADCYGQTFLAALELSGRQKVRNYGGLLRCLCTCRAMDRLRKRGREEGLADWSNVASANPGPVEEAQAAELSQRLRGALGKLPGK
jgi:DNA-directed RNA polymerase specialized sigma24 family protein